jgi:hypothetical protein
MAQRRARRLDALAVEATSMHTLPSAGELEGELRAAAEFEEQLAKARERQGL